MDPAARVRRVSELDYSVFHPALGGLVTDEHIANMFPFLCQRFETLKRTAVIFISQVAAHPVQIMRVWSIQVSQGANSF